jgi:hypothetical protein
MIKFLCFIYFAARVITVAIETGDLNLMLSFSLSVLLNLAVILSLVIFTEDNNSNNNNDSAENKIDDRKNK